MELDHRSKSVKRIYKNQSACSDREYEFIIEWKRHWRHEVIQSFIFNCCWWKRTSMAPWKTTNVYIVWRKTTNIAYFFMFCSDNSTEYLGEGYCNWFSLPKTKTKVITTQEKWYFICTHHTNMGETLDQIIKNVISYWCILVIVRICHLCVCLRVCVYRTFSR